MPGPVSLTARAVVCAFGSGEAALWEGLLSGETRVAPCAALEGRRAATVPEGSPLPPLHARDRVPAVSLARRL